MGWSSLMLGAEAYVLTAVTETPTIVPLGGRLSLLILGFNRQFALRRTVHLLEAELQTETDRRICSRFFRGR